ncbi:glycosyltransferase [Microbacterium sp. MYb62]|uniref:glycosyltransferase n=1 Tax=Microbacterium sp. MYb62 TaxID=1848690 RepID=UPI000CFC895F|nr:glycosyltransferase [Microbacterium sp. MYb62]PRB17247.1 glycosyl transferase [Microbacterium sp. MYb62]
MTDDNRAPYLLVHPGWELFGSDRMLLETARGLREKGERVVAALPERGPLVEKLQSAGVEVLIPPMFVLRKSSLHPRNWLRSLRDAIRGIAASVAIVRRLRPRTIYVSTIVLPSWPLIGRLAGVPTVTHVHEAEASASRLVNFVLYAPHLAAHRIIANSRFTLQTVSAVIPALGRRATVIPNGVASPEEVAPPRAHIDRLRVGYVGRLSHRKGPDVAVEALARLADDGVDAELHLVGDVFSGNEEFDRRLRDRVSALGVDDRVAYLGFQQDIWPLLAEVDVLVVPSRQDESFGNTAVEGILAARPVIASDIAGLREAIDPYESATFVVPGDAEDLARALRTVRDDWETRRAVAITDRDAALGRFAPDAYRRTVAAFLGSRTRS